MAKKKIKPQESDSKESSRSLSAQTKKKKKDKENYKKDDDSIPLPKNWKTMGKRQRDDWLAQQALQLKVKMEAAKILRQERLRQQEIEQNELISTEASRQEIRKDILAKTCALFRKHEKAREDHDLQDMLKAQWKFYVRCDGLPDPTRPPQLNEYLIKWKNNSYHECTEQDLCRRYQDVVSTLDLINMVMSKSWTLPPETVKNIQQARSELRHQLVQALELTSYNILRDVDRNLSVLTSKIRTYRKEIKELKLHIWVALKSPPKLKNPHSPPPMPTKLSFPELKLDVTIPPVIDTTDVSVRVICSMADLYSPLCNTFELANTLPNQNDDLFSLNEKEYDYLQEIRIQNIQISAAFYMVTNQRIKELDKLIKQNPFRKMVKEKEELQALVTAEPPHILGGLNPRERIYKEDDDSIKPYLLSNFPVADDMEINLRKYRICGGVLQIDLFEIPPQSKYIKEGIYLSTLTLPIEMRPIDYKVEIEPTIILEEKKLTAKEEKKKAKIEAIRTKEEIRMAKDEIQRQKEERKAEIAKLVLVKMRTPKNIICFEQPVACQWNTKKSLWTTKNIFDYVYDKIDYTMQFKTSKLWPIGIAVPRYSNMPYANWEMKKDPRAMGVLFTLQGVYINVTILCRNRVVVLKEVSFRNTNAVATYFKQFTDRAMTVNNLKTIFQEAGCDIFPDFDAHNYAQGSCMKNWVIERHLYHAMAFLSKGYSFKFSKWNCKAGTRNIVCQVREECNSKGLPEYKLLYANPESCTYLRHGEDMEEFSNEQDHEIEFFPDLFTFNMSYGSFEARKRAFGMSYKLTETIFDLLQEIKPCSFA